MGKTAKISDEFAAAMQQLSAEAAQTTHLEDLRPEQYGNGAAHDALPHIVNGVRKLAERIENLETSLGQAMEKLEKSQPADINTRLKYSKLLLQRPRVSNRLRMRVKRPSRVLSAVLFSRNANSKKD